MSDQTISVLKGNPSARQAAAISAAIDLYSAEISALAAATRDRDSANNWQRAALREAVEARRVVADVWGSAPIGPG